MTNSSSIRCLSRQIAIVLLISLSQEARAGFVDFSTGYTVPETISQAPTGFGSLAGSYLVPDGSGNRIQLAPPSGGPSSTFATLPYSAVGGVFLPTSYGTQGGQFLSVGFDVNSNTSFISYFNQSGNLTGGPSLGSSAFATPLLAPSTFGTVGGQVLVSDEFYGIHVLSSSGNLSNFVSLPAIVPFGMAFAPASFGNQSGRLLVSDLDSGLILSVTSDGQVSTFANLHLNPGQTGLRQMGFVPDGFGSLSGLLLVSVSGAQFGGGTLGSLLALDSSGDVVESLKIGTDVNAFDPRGLAFLQDGSILVSDSSQPGKILILNQGNFAGTPEPSSWILCGTGFVALFAFQWRQGARRRRRQLVTSN